MKDYAHLEYGIGITVKGDSQMALKCFKQYTRGGKVFWRNYHRNVNGGMTIMELFEISRERTAAKIIESLSMNIYSTGT